MAYDNNGAMSAVDASPAVPKPEVERGGVFKELAALLQKLNVGM